MENVLMALSMIGYMEVCRQRFIQAARMIGSLREPSPVSILSMAREEAYQRGNLRFFSDMEAVWCSSFRANVQEISGF